MKEISEAFLSMCILCIVTIRNSVQIDKMFSWFFFLSKFQIAQLQFLHSEFVFLIINRWNYCYGEWKQRKDDSLKKIELLINS